MLIQLDYFISNIQYLIKTKIFKNDIPFIGGLVINQKCNLKCQQCNVSNKNSPDLTFNEVKSGLKELYKLGIRSIAITGGEPLLWTYNNYNINDVINVTRRIGFKVSSIYTNGTLPIKISCDNVFVSMDGLKKTTNKLRGKIYNKVIENIKNSKHPKIFINFTINKKNYMEIENFCKMIKKIKNIKGIFFYFHTPYYGIDDLFLNNDEKKETINLIISLKRKYKILNSAASLKNVYYNSWSKPSKICYVYSNTKKIFQCCREIGNKLACENCGYLGYTEIQNIIKFKLTSIISALNYLPSKKAREIYS